jgi:hypothetical protein
MSAGEPLGSREAVSLLPHAQRSGLDAGSFGQLADGQVINHEAQQLV